MNFKKGSQRPHNLNYLLTRQKLVLFLQGESETNYIYESLVQQGLRVNQCQY